jgi:hypothetical protein
MVDDPPDSPGVSRRTFLKTGAAGAAGTAMLGTLSGEAEAQAARSKIVGPGTVPIELHVNGAKKKVRVEPRTTLAQALRESLGLTGT